MIYLLIGFFLSGAKISMQIIKSKHLMLNVKETLLFVGYVLMWIFGVKISSNQVLLGPKRSFPTITSKHSILPLKMTDCDLSSSNLS